MTTVRVRVKVKGRVQGVFYRESCRTEARRLGVSGWVRNEADGSVQGVFEGEPGDVDRLVAWCRQGPPVATVDHVHVAPEAATQILDGFEVRH